MTCARLDTLRPLAHEVQPGHLISTKDRHFTYYCVCILKIISTGIEALVSSDLVMTHFLVTGIMLVVSTVNKGLSPIQPPAL